MKTHMREEAFYCGLDAGIRFAVRVLHAAGIETCQSCQGGEGHAYHEPSIDLPVSSDDAQGFAALAALKSYGIDVLTVGMVWTVNDGLPRDLVWRIELRRTYPDRADERPIFVTGYVGQDAHPS